MTTIKTIIELVMTTAKLLKASGFLIRTTKKIYFMWKLSNLQDLKKRIKWLAESTVKHLLHAVRHLAITCFAIGGLCFVSFWVRFMSTFSFTHAHVYWLSYSLIFASLGGFYLWLTNDLVEQE